MTFYTRLFFVFAVCLTANAAHAQQKNKSANPPIVIDDFSLPLVYDKDSLVGFDEATTWRELRESGVELWRQRRLMSVKKREFIDRKYNLRNFISDHMVNGKPIGGGSNSIMQACTNVDFEQGNLGGWTAVQSPNNNSQTMLPWTSSATGNIVVVGPGMDPNGLPISQVPPGGGSFAVRLGPTGAGSGGYSYRLSQTFTVTPANSVFIYKYAAVLNKAPHSCTEQPFFNIRFEDCNNNPIPCGAYNVNAIGSACTIGDNTFVNQGQWAYKNWTTRAFDLSAYIGQCVNIEFTVGGCVISQGAHGGYAYVDCSCQPMNLMLNNTVIPTGSTTAAVCTAGTNTLCAPLGFNYTWSGPGVNGNTSQCINVSSPGAYSVALSTPGQNCFNPGLSCNFVVSQPPIADFSFTSTPCASSINVVSTSSVNGGSAITNYLWNWNDGSPTSSLNPSSHGYLTPGPKQIKLKVTNSSGCSDSIIKTVNVSIPPIVNFSVNPVCMNSPSSFTNGSTTGGAASNNYTWTFGSGLGTSNAVNPTFTFPASGIMNVQLSATNSDGCSASIQKTVEVYGRAVVDFTPTGVCFGNPSNFVNLSTTSQNPNTAGITGFSWNFGDGGTSNQQNPVYTYTSPANATANTNYNVWFYATTAHGCKDSVSKQVTVYSAPTPDFIADSVCLGNATSFQDVSSGNGNPVFLFVYDWNSDGIADLTQNSVSASNTFTSWGNNAVTYTVITAPQSTTLSCYNSITKNVWVHPGPLAGISHNDVCVDAQPMQISGAPSTIPVGIISNYSWNYGDGNSSAVNANAATTHSYAMPGVYVVTLTASSANGCASVATRTVEVWDRPYGSFAYSKTCFGKQTTLSASQTGTTSITSFGWDLNNNQANTEAVGASVVYTFTAEGTQPINLLLTSNRGCQNIVPGNVYINYNPKPNFYAPKRSGCTDLCINIIDSSEVIPGPAKNALWQWNFGNGQTLNATNSTTTMVCYKNDSYQYLKRYDVRLVLTTDSGCVDSVHKFNYVTVYPKPFADFTWQGQDGDVLTPIIKFNNASIGHNYFQWYFNDAWNALDSINNNPSHYFNTDEPKTVNVYLAIKNYYGCKDTVMKPIEIGPNFTFYIPNTFTPNEDGVNELFTGTGIGIKNFKMWIFDRWGEMIYFTEDIRQGWDGSVKGKKVDGKTDVYQYKVIVQDMKGKSHQYIGHVTLLK